MQCPSPPPPPPLPPPPSSSPFRCHIAAGTRLLGNHIPGTKRAQLVWTGLVRRRRILWRREARPALQPSHVELLKSSAAAAPRITGGPRRAASGVPGAGRKEPAGGKFGGFQKEGGGLSERRYWRSAVVTLQALHAVNASPS
ncbi:hypothetical protein EYF80_054392 [Liparis tanakae]|uniref:Uncharacterized protein n=1 Tax=Liparis tanakae TaxID=230148 RepID=A0A4Z2F2T4_9TELE|nr:hypothetical protein EYF80_054392 [Liparis tanakae]